MHPAAPLQLDLIPIYLAQQRELIERLAERVRYKFRMPVRVRRRWFDPETAYDRSRGQYNSRVLLKLLLADPGHDASKVIGVTSVDLFTPVLTHVFGEGQLDGRVAVVSAHRLRPEAYGLPEDEGLVFSRLETETVHELGHTFGLLHCFEPSCVMHASTYVEEIDLKSPEFCTDCLRALADRSHAGQSA
jgi:archaemetzincin